MPARVVLNGPPRHAVRTMLARGAASVAGSVLMVIALAAVWPVLVLTFLVPWWLFGSGPDKPSAVVLPLWIGTGVLAWLAHFAGVRLLAGSRRMVLYLRRFGHIDATRTVTAAVARIGGFWRIVTLDDGSVTPVGVRGIRTLNTAGKLGGRGYTVVTVVGHTVLYVGILGGLAVVALLVTGRGDVLERLGVPGPENQFKLLETLVLFIGGILAVMFAGFVLMIVFAPFIAAIDSAASNMRAAESRKALRITNEASIGVARQVIATQSRRVISARLFVLKVETSVWRTTVATFGRDAAIPLIDITEPTENILWEIDRMHDLFGSRCVFVGQYERLAHLFVIPEPDSIVARLQSRLDGCDVLAYRSTRRGAQHFARALRAVMETKVATR